MGQNNIVAKSPEEDFRTLSAIAKDGEITPDEKKFIENIFAGKGRVETIDVGDELVHTTGTKIKVLARVETYYHGKCWVVEDLSTGKLSPVNGSPGSMVNWTKVG